MNDTEQLRALIPNSTLLETIYVVFIIFVYAFVSVTEYSFRGYSRQDWLYNDVIL